MTAVLTPFPRRILLAFGAISLLFLVGAVLANWSSYEIEVHTDVATTNTLPSIVHLTAAGDALRDLEEIVDDFPTLTQEQRANTKTALRQKWGEIDRELERYLTLPTYPGEHDMYEAAVPGALHDVESDLARLLADGEAGRPESPQLERDLREASNRAAFGLQTMVKFNATRAEDEVARIAEIHRSASVRALLFATIAALSTIPLAFWVVRQFRAYDSLSQAHTVVLEQRAAELEMFGERVGHDLLSPLSALTFCLGAFKRVSETDPKLQEALTRARACVARAQVMVHGLFEFARSGGQPEHGYADLHEVLSQVADGVRALDGEEPTEVTIEPFDACTVACTSGVLTSILSNLLRNAAKYMRDSAVKRITVRVREKGESIRVEVEDTGPGIPTALAHRVFEPYVRAEGVTQPGLGLGLSTVKRLCEGHGGAVGVRSRLGEGALFWFTLPKASGVADSAPPASAATVRRVS